MSCENRDCSYRTSPVLNAREYRSAAFVSLYGLLFINHNLSSKSTIWLTPCQGPCDQRFSSTLCFDAAASAASPVADAPNTKRRNFTNRNPYQMRRFNAFLGTGSSLISLERITQEALLTETIFTYILFSCTEEFTGMSSRIVS